MAGCAQGLIGSLKKAAAPPPSSFFRCTSFQISIGCCSNTSQCGTFGGGVSCATQTNPGPNDENSCV
jgi:hypothetical protein